MPKRLLILLLPVVLGSCVTEQKSALPMALAPSDTARASCLTYRDMPTFSDCESTSGSLTKEQNGR
jgi:hypothetical protein